MDDLLVRLLNVKHLIVGDDFHFARKRSGSIADLERKAVSLGFTVEQVGSVIESGERVSSSVVRRLLEAGDTDSALFAVGFVPHVWQGCLRSVARA